MKCLNLYLLIFILIIVNNTVQSQMYGAWENLGSDINISYTTTPKALVCNTAGGRTVWRVKNDGLRHCSGKITFDYLDCDDVRRESFTYFDLKPGQINENSGAYWVFGYNISNIQIKFDSYDDLPSKSSSLPAVSATTSQSSSNNQKSTEEINKTNKPEEVKKPNQNKSNAGVTQENNEAIKRINQLQKDQNDFSQKDAETKAIFDKKKHDAQREHNRSLKEQKEDYIDLDKADFSEDKHPELNQDYSSFHNSVNYTFSLAYFFIVGGEFLKSISNYLAVNNYIENPQILINLAYAYNKLGDLINTEKYLSLYLKIIPNDANITSKLAQLYIIMGNAEVKNKAYEKALENYFKSLKILPEQKDAILFNNIAYCYWQLHNIKEAKIYYQKAAKLGCSSAKAWLAKNK